MISSEFAEDIFKTFYNLISQQKISVQGQDFSPIASFHEKIINGNELTKNQANFLIKLLEKYKTISAMAGLDYKSQLQDLKWRRGFRVLDLSKKIYVELRENKLEICLKFPYQLKKQFEDEIDNRQTIASHSFWDHEHKVRRLDFYRYNLIHLYEFALTHNFEIDDTFMNVLADVEEIWQNSDDIIPRSEVTIYGVALKNTSEATQQWWSTHRTSDPLKDLLLAKSMGFLYQEKPMNFVEKIASCPENTFWIKHHKDFFELTKLFSGRICVLLDRTTAHTLPWLQNFVAAADTSGISREEIKVCFRNSKESDTGLNEWIKAAGVGGQVESGKILIFESKPAKWLFKSDIDVTMLVTNNIFPPTSIMAKDWLRSHPCVIYLGDTKPTEPKGQKIVEL
jgi:hypothetical protein